MTLLPELRAEDFAPILSGADYGEAFFEESQGISILFETRASRTWAKTAERGLGLRFLRRAEGAVETLMGSSQNIAPAEAARLRAGLFGENNGGRPATVGPRTSYRHAVRVDPDAVPLEEKIGLLKRIDASLRAEFEGLRQVSLTYGERRRDLAILNSEGANLREERASVVFVVNVVAQKNGVLQTGHEVLGALKGCELLEDGAAESAARRAARRALRKIAAPPAKAGEMPIVLSSAAAAPSSTRRSAILLRPTTSRREALRPIRESWGKPSLPRRSR